MESWEGEGEWEGLGGETNRLLEEIREYQELLSSPSELGEGPGLVGTTSDDTFQASFDQDFEFNEDDIQSTAQPDNGIYSGRLRSYSSFDPTPTSTLSDTSSQCTNTEMVNVMFDQSHSDGDGSVNPLNCRRLRPQRRVLKGKSTHLHEFVPSRRSYECDVCGKLLHSPQSLGGHKNLHRIKGKGPLRARNRPQASTSSESETVASIFKGVRCREGDKWVTEIRPPKKSEKWWLGTFASAEEAAQAYDVALAFFKSESELNFGYHPLYKKFPALPPPNLSPIKYAQRLRGMVKEISAQIIAERRLLEEQMTNPHTVSPAGSSTSTVEHLSKSLDDIFPVGSELPASDLEWITYLNYY